MTASTRSTTLFLAGLGLSWLAPGPLYALDVNDIEQQAYLKPSNTDQRDEFGRALAIDGDTLVIGAHKEDSSATGVNGDQLDNSVDACGAVYVFVRTGSVWTQQAYLKASNTDSGDEFGWAVDISADTCVVGARFEDSASTGIDGDQASNAAARSGAVYVFTRTGTTWSQQAYIKASNTGASDEFGRALAIDGDTLVVGAPKEESDGSGVNGDQGNNDAPDSGAAYVFVRSGTTWSQQAYVKAPVSDTGDEFGFSVDVESDRMVIGARQEDSVAAIAGGVHVYTRSGSAWSHESALTASNGETGDRFGVSVSLSGGTLVVGANLERSNATGIGGNEADNSAFGAGAVYVFGHAGTSWLQQAYLKASNTDQDDRFGTWVSIDGDTIGVGAHSENSNANGVNGNEANNDFPDAGAAYLFCRSGTTWSQAAYLKASNPRAGDLFGNAIAVDGTTAVASARFEDSFATGANGNQFDDTGTDSGAVYVFDLDFVSAFPRVGIDTCSGDGGNQMGCTNCPCMNNAPMGTVGGCLNSAGTSARLSAGGDTSVSLPSGSLTDLRFSLTGAPPTAFGVLNSGDNVAPANMANPCFGLNSGIQSMLFDGLRCAIGSTRRHGGRSADGNGDVGVTNNPWGGEGAPPAGIAQAGGAFASGQTRHFQVTHRDDPLLSCMRGLNTTQAVEVTFTP